MLKKCKKLWKKKRMQEFVINQKMNHSGLQILVLGKLELLRQWMHSFKVVMSLKDN